MSFLCKLNADVIILPHGTCRNLNCRTIAGSFLHVSLRSPSRLPARVTDSTTCCCSYGHSACCFTSPVGRHREALLDRRWEKNVSGPRSRQAGGAAWSDPASVGAVRPHHRSHGEFPGCGGWEQKKSPDFRSRMGWIGGGTGERDEHVPPGSFKFYTLHLRSCLASA
jgi:hypothetical protein